MRQWHLFCGPAQYQTLGILAADGLYTNLGLLVSDQCQHSIKLAVFQGTDKLLFKDRKEFGGSIFQQLNEAYQAVDFYNGTPASFEGLLRKDERDYPMVLGCVITFAACFSIINLVVDLLYVLFDPRIRQQLTH